VQQHRTEQYNNIVAEFGCEAMACQRGHGRAPACPWQDDLLLCAGCNQASPLLCKSLVYLDIYYQVFNQRYIFVSTFIISGAMKLESTIFRPREVVKHALQTAAASLKKELTLEGCIGSDLLVEVNRKENDLYIFCNLRTWMNAMIMLIS
jgi:hypothetical protein